MRLNNSIHSRLLPRHSVASALVVLAVVLGSCASTPPPPPLPTTSIVAIPAEQGSFFQFSSEGVTLHTGESMEKKDWPSNAGESPIASALDLQSSMACVAYPSAIAFIDLSSMEQTALISHEFGSEIRGLSLGGLQATLWSNEDVLIVHENGKVKRESLKAFLDRSGTPYIQYCGTTENESELVLMACEPYASFSDGLRRVYLLDKSSGTWMQKKSSDFVEFSTIHKIKSDGASIFAAGVKEKSQLR